MFFHKESGEGASEHTVRLKKDAQVAQLLAEVSAQLGAQYEGKQLRLLEAHASKLYKVSGRGGSGTRGSVDGEKGWHTPASSTRWEGGVVLAVGGGVARLPRK